MDEKGKILFPEYRVEEAFPCRMSLKVSDHHDLHDGAGNNPCFKVSQRRLRRHKEGVKKV